MHCSTFTNKHFTHAIGIHAAPNHYVTFSVFHSKHYTIWVIFFTNPPSYVCYTRSAKDLKNTMIFIIKKRKVYV